MRPRNEPRGLRKIVVTIAAGLVATAFFIAFFTSSYIFLPPQTRSAGDEANPVSAPADVSQATDLTKHGHAALMVFVNGVLLDFSGAEYQNKGIMMHFENNDGFTLHIHDRAAWLGPFFESIGMSLDNNCLSLRNGAQYCSNFENQVTFSVNGKPNGEFQHYTPRDGDKILLSYVNEGIKDQLANLDSLTIRP